MTRRGKRDINVISPCIRQCKIENGSCIGCKRTQEEISKWLWLTNEERQLLMDQIKQR